MAAQRAAHSLQRESMYSVSINFDPGLRITKHLGSEIQETAESMGGAARILYDTRLNMVGLIIEPLSDAELIARYMVTLSATVNNNFMNRNLDNMTAESMRQLGYVLAFAAPTPLSHLSSKYVKMLEDMGITTVARGAFSPVSRYPLHYVDIWVSKLQIQPIVAPNVHPSEIRSPMVMQYLASLG